MSAGEYFDAGGVRFTCPSEGDDCSLTVTLVENSINVTSAGGMATATLVTTPPKTTVSRVPLTTQQSRKLIPRRNGLFDLTGVIHELHTANFPVFENGRIVQKKLAKPKEVDNVVAVPEFSKFRIQDGKSRDFGRVRFSCRGAGCEVLVVNTFERGFEVRYEGNVTATLLFDASKMSANIFEYRTEYCFRDDNNCGLLSFSPSRTIGSKEFMFGIAGFGSYIVPEDMNTQIPSNYGWQGKRYAYNVDGERGELGFDKKARVEMVIYNNADGPEDTDYLTYGRSMLISGNGSTWYLDGSFTKSIGSQYGLGDRTGKVTYRGGATGWYTFTGADAEAGHFTARAKLQADLGSALELSGTIDRFVDQEGRSRNWKVDLTSSNFEGGNRSNALIQPRKNTVWTINNMPSGTAGNQSKGRKWRGRVANEGNSIHGSFQASFNKDGKNGRLNGAYGAESR